MIGWMAALAAVAEAHGEAGLRVENHFDGEVEVLVDGRFASMVGGDASVDLETRPGRHEVTVVRPSTGYTLAATRVQLVPGGLVLLPVEAPPSTLRLENQGEVPLRLSVQGRDTWLVPGTVLELPVASGTVTVTATAHEPRGDFFAASRTVWVEPGQVASATLRPDPTVVVVDDHGVVPVRVLVDGRDAGSVNPGTSRRIWVRPGPSVVTLVDPYGRVLSETRLVVERGSEARVVLAGPGPVHGIAWGAPPWDGDDHRPEHGWSPYAGSAR